MTQTKATESTESTEFVEAEIFNICVCGMRGASSYMIKMIYIPSTGMEIHSDGIISDPDPRHPDLRYYAHEAKETVSKLLMDDKIDHKQMLADEHKKHCKIIMIPLNVVKQLENLNKKKQKSQDEIHFIAQTVTQLSHSSEILSDN